MSKSIISEVATKIKSEMKDLSSDAHDSILRDSMEAVKHFHWDTVMLELLDKIPTLMSLLSQLVRRPAEQKPLLCFLASQLLKSRHQHIGISTASGVCHDVWKWYCQTGTVSNCTGISCSRP